MTVLASYNWLGRGKGRLGISGIAFRFKGVTSPDSGKPGKKVTMDSQASLAVFRGIAQTSGVGS